MKSAIAFLAAAILGAMPAAAQQQQEQHQQPHPASHPAMHAPAPAMHTVHPATHAHVVVHHPAHHAIHGHVTAHHVARHAVAYHTRHAVHVAHGVVRLGHRTPRAVVVKLRKNVIAVHRFHIGAYRAPPGWHYRRWVFGERLPAVYFGRDYWITDYLSFDLFAPPDGLVWVRYGPDALLIDEYTGEVVQVQYGVFY